MPAIAAAGIEQMHRRGIECDPDALARLVVVTYTNAAAEELRVRARALLLGDAPRSDLLPRFRQAFFGTIHSFCLKLVSEFGAELGIAADSELLDDEGLEPWTVNELWIMSGTDPNVAGDPQSLNLFLRAGAAPSDRSMVDFDIDAGCRG